MCGAVKPRGAMLFDLFFIRCKEALSRLRPEGHLAAHLRGLQVGRPFLQKGSDSVPGDNKHRESEKPQKFREDVHDHKQQPDSLAFSRSSHSHAGLEPFPCK